MKLCECPRPVRDAVTRDRLRCSGCGGWTPNGAPSSRVDFAKHGDEAASLLENAVREYEWLEGALYGLQRGDSSSGRSSGVSDPTGVQVASEDLDRARDWAALASRLIKRVLDELERVDEAVGEARYALERGPSVKVDYAATDSPCPKCKGTGRVSLVPVHLADQHAAQRRRFLRGEGVPR